MKSCNLISCELNGVEPKETVVATIFFKQYEENPRYLQHYSPAYWADFIIDQMSEIRTKWGEHVESVSFDDATYAPWMDADLGQ